MGVHAGLGRGERGVRKSVLVPWVLPPGEVLRKESSGGSALNLSSRGVSIRYSTPTNPAALGS